MKRYLHIVTASTKVTTKLLLIIRLIILVELLFSIVRPANRDWACQTERCHTLSNKTSLQ